MNQFQKHNAVVPPLGSLSDFLFGLGKEAIGANRVQQEFESANAEIDHRPTVEDVDEYARCLERAQRKIGVRTFNPPTEENF